MSDLEPWVTPDGETRYLGNKPSTLMLVTKGRLPDLPNSELRPFCLRDDPKYSVKIKDQNGKGACNGHAAASSLEMARYVAGLPHVELSPWLVYADLCNGWDVGSNIAEALQYLEQNGTCPAEMVPYGTINPRSVPAAARAAAEYKIEIGYRLETFRDLCIAAALRMPFNFSVPVNSGFNNLDKDGCPQNKPGPHNHAVTGGEELVILPSGELAIGMNNSWSPKWGWNGRCRIKERNTEGSGWDAYCVVATITNPSFMPPRLK